MSFAWLTWSNPVSIWWGFLLIVSIVNVALWLLLARHPREAGREHRPGLLGLEPMVLLSAAYVFGCAFRAILPRADVERICLFDTWLSSVFIGRSVATVAELCFVMQWAILLHHLAGWARSNVTRSVAGVIVPLIIVAECCSWYAVITANYLGNVIENSLWAVTFLAIAVALVPPLTRFIGVARLAMAAAIAGIAGYLTFMSTVDIPMYFGRWQADLASGKELFGLFGGLYDASAHWVVTHDIVHWRDEIAWKTLYFSAAVWSSLALGGFPLIKHALPRYRDGRGSWRAARRTLSGRAVGQWLWPPMLTPGSVPSHVSRPRARSPR